MKMNKKGFTLIEMLVVIAIIAVLVSIIIPVVGNSTDKAACATNAANLRSALASAQVAILQDLPDAAGTITIADGKGTYGDQTFKVSASVDCSLCEAGVPPTISYDAEGNVTVNYNDVTIEQFAAAAGGGTSAE